VIQIPAQASVLVMHEPVSFRMGIDGMVGVARVVLAQEPMSGALFVFRNRRRQMLRPMIIGFCSATAIARSRRTTSSS
jgi:transposase